MRLWFPNIVFMVNLGEPGDQANPGEPDNAANYGEPGNQTTQFK